MLHVEIVAVDGLASGHCSDDLHKDFFNITQSSTKSIALSYFVDNFTLPLIFPPHFLSASLIRGVINSSNISKACVIGAGSGYIARIWKLWTFW